MSHIALVLVVLAGLVGGLGASAGELPSAPERDRRAILAMAGEYQVAFHFRETLALRPGYELKPPYDETATEFVSVIEDTGRSITLQHILVLHDATEDDASAARVVKHWRQQWRYEPESTWAYIGNRAWTHRALSESERAGAWVQEVYQVDDSPRYASVGRWTHQPGGASSVVGSAWEGEATWRPLPRREWLKRSDYHVLIGRNRHTLTPTGWVHEQDNHKVLLDDSGKPVGSLAREWGHNIYDRRGEGIATQMKIDFAPGYAYWTNTSAFWADVRAAWARRLGEPGRTIVLVGKVDDRPMFRHLFDYAKQVHEQGAYDAPAGRRFIEETVARFEGTSK